jgi:tetratricopeptide (TPR) repeat protein
MLIAQIEPPHLTRGGDWFYRTHAPGRAMAELDGITVVDLTNTHRCRDALLAEADVVVLNMVCDPDLLPILGERTKRGQLTVYEVNDDVAYMQAANPAAGFFANPQHQTLFRRLIHSSSAVQFCTPELQRRYGYLNPRQALFRNQLSWSAAQRKPRRDERVVIGWGGSAGHLDDITHVAGPLIDFLNTREDVVLHLMASDRIVQLFDRLDAQKKRLTPTGSLDDYYTFVADLDIGIAPLDDTGFNRCRSDVKFLEYAMHGVVPVLQSLAPYRDAVVAGTTGFFFESPEQLIGTLERLLNEPALGDRVSNAARHYVESERRERDHAHERIDFYRSLATTPVTKTRSTSDYAAVPGAEVAGRHIALNATEYEQLLHDALVVGQMQGQRELALRMLRRASEIEPLRYQPYLFASAMSEAPLDELAACLAKNPRSLSARVARADGLEQSGMNADAIRELLGAAQIHPAYDLPYVRVAELLERSGQGAEAREFFLLARQLRLPLERNAPPA